MSKQPPSVIYLQWFGDPADCRCDSECTEGGEGGVTWCEDRQHDVDVKYVLESALKERDDELQRLRLYLQDTSEGFEHIETCDSNGCDGEGGCPVSNIPAAFRILRERLKERDATIAELSKMVNAAHVALQETQIRHNQIEHGLFRGACSCGAMEFVNQELQTLDAILLIGELQTLDGIVLVAEREKRNLP